MWVSLMYQHCIPDFLSINNGELLKKIETNIIAQYLSLFQAPNLILQELKDQEQQKIIWLYHGW